MALIDWACIVTDYQVRQKDENIYLETIEFVSQMKSVMNIIMSCHAVL